MIEIADKKKCCGCGACLQACPKHCISFLKDSEGFLYPKVNKSMCIDCGICEKACPFLNPFKEREMTHIYAAINNNESIRQKSSSGGIFTVLAEQIISKGGVVFGARFDEEWKVVIDAAETIEQVAAFRGSKYLQARVGDSYRRCKTYLDTGREVLFSGTPCQISGLLHYLRKPYSKLLTVDFICHGVPSPEVWKRYIGDIVKAGTKAIHDVQYRNKHDGWQSFSFYMSYDEQNKTIELLSPANKNPYMLAFLNNIILRPSCYTCALKSGRSNSDITIADFWSVDKICPDMYDDRGTSLVIIYNEKGFNTIPFDKIKYEEVSVESLRFNPSYYESPQIHHRRQDFFAGFSSGINIKKLLEHALRPSFRQRISPIFLPYRKLKKIVKLILKKNVVSDKQKWGGHISEDEQIFIDKNNNDMELIKIEFRDKRFSWNSNYLRLSFKIKEKQS